MKIVNLTKHNVNIIQEGKVVVTFEPSGLVARRNDIGDRHIMNLLVQNGKKQVEIPVISKCYGEIKGLPKEKPGTMYIVSAIVAKKSGRSDLLVPADTITKDGKVLGCKALSLYR